MIQISKLHAQRICSWLNHNVCDLMLQKYKKLYVIWIQSNMSKTGLHIFNQCTVVWDVMRVWEFFKYVCVFFPRLTGFRIFLLFFIWWYTCVHLSCRALECKNTIDVCIKTVGLVQQVFWGMKNKLFKYRRIEVEVLHIVATKLLFFF